MQREESPRERDYSGAVLLRGKVQTASVPMQRRLEPDCHQPQWREESPQEQDHNGERLRGKLNHLGVHFKDFDKQIGEEARQRKLLGAQRAKEVQAALNRIEDSLTAESREREEVAKQAEQAVDKWLDKMVGNLSSLIIGRFEQLLRSVESLSERCSTIERGIQQFKGDVPSKLRVESSALRQAIRKLTADFQGDRKLLTERDSVLLRAVEDAERSIERQQQEEVAQFETRRESLLELLEQIVSDGEKSEGFKERRLPIDRGLSALEADLSQEVVARERADDQVVQAINECMEKLHRTLRMTTS